MYPGLFGIEKDPNHYFETELDFRREKKRGVDRVQGENNIEQLSVIKKNRTKRNALDKRNMMPVFES